jgi:hypothetical protein
MSTSKRLVAYDDNLKLHTADYAVKLTATHSTHFQVIFFINYGKHGGQTVLALFLDQ